MANFDDITLFGSTSLSDIFKQIHRNNKDTDKQINELIDALKPLASSNAGSAVMLMPTVKDLIDVNVKNNEQLIKMDYNNPKRKKMYVTLSPCLSCAKLILNANIDEVYYLEEYRDLSGVDLLSNFGVIVKKLEIG